MEITFEQFRDSFRSTSNTMLMDYEHDHVRTDEDRMMILLFGEMMERVCENEELMKICYKEYLGNRDFINK